MQIADRRERDTRMNNNLFKRTGAADFPTHLKVMVSGPPKSGKTSLLGTVPGLIVLDTEPHANNLASIAHLDVPYVTITNTDDLRQVAFMLKDDTLRKQIAAQYGLPDIKGVAIDTLDSLQKIMKAERMKEQRSTQFLRDDWGWLKTEMEAIVEMFTSLPMHVFFMVHTKTQEMGKGDESYTVVLPGLEGSIAQSIAGMVGYSLLSFRKEEVAPDGSPITKYYLRTEGDSTHDFLGTRTAGRLPTIIEPDMRTIYNAVMSGRPARPAQVDPNPTAPAAPVATPPAQAPTEAPTEAPAEEVAQTQGQAEPTSDARPDSPAPSTEAAPAPEPTSAPAEQSAPPADPAPAAPVPADARPGDEEPVNPAALTHVKRVYDAIEVPFPEKLLIEQVNMGQAREIVKMWRAIQQDHAENKAPVGSSPQSEMLEFLSAMGWVDETMTASEKPAEVEPKVDGTIEEVMAYVGSDLTKVQEAYDLEVTKDSPRKSLISKLEGLGAKTVQTSVQTTEPAPEPASEAVTSEPAPADAPPTEEEAVQAVADGLGGVVVEQKLREDAPCEVCGKTIDDYDLALLGQKRFNKILCVNDYLAEQRQ